MAPRRKRDDSEEKPRPSKRGRKSIGADDLDDGGDVPLPPSGSENPKGAKAPVRARTRTSSLPESQESNMSDSSNHKLAGILNAIIIGNDTTLRNTLRTARRLQGIKLLRLVKPSLPSEPEMRLEQVVSGAAVQSRNIVAGRCRKEGNASAWRTEFKTTDNTDPPHYVLVPYSTLPEDASAKDKDKMHQELVRIYNTWPWETDEVDIPLRREIIASAASNVLAQPRQVDDVTHSNTVTYQTKVHYIDQDTGAHKRLNVSATATDEQMSQVDVPRLPVINVRNTGSGTISRRDPDNPTYLPAPTFEKKKLGKKQKSSRASQQKAEDAVYWLSAQLQGLITTESRIKELQVMYRQQIGLQRGTATQQGMYGGEAPLYRTSVLRARACSYVSPTTKVYGDLGLPKGALQLTIHSMNASRTTPVLETIVQLFCAGQDIRFAWIEAAKTADCVNNDIADGVPPSSRCDCDDTSGNEMHVCESCTRPVFCKSRSYDSLGRLVCAACYRRDQASFMSSHSSYQSLASYLAYKSLWNSFRRECAVRGFDPQEKECKSIFETAWTSLQMQLPNHGKVKGLPEDQLTTYVDQWTGLTHDIGEERTNIGRNPSHRRFVPFGITVDAIERQGRPKYKSLKHSKDNLKITSITCQYAKGQFLPGVIHEIGEFKRKSDEEQSSPQAQQQLIDKMTSMALVVLKRPFINSGRGALMAKWDKIHAESVAGAPTPNEPGPWEDAAKRFVHPHKSVPAYDPADTEGSAWSGGVWESLQKCAQSMEKYFGITLHQLSDGTRWMGTKDSNPEGLDRNGVAILCDERLARMRTVCNKKWQTKDTAVTLYLEIIFQYCCSNTPKADLQHLKKKYGDRLHLPLVLAVCSPLRFSVAHRTHGFGMLSGWVSELPTDVQERIDNDGENNMLIESWYLNSAKQDMTEEYYPVLGNILCHGNITDKAIYNPGTVPMPIYGSEPSTGELDNIEDTYAGPMLDAAAVSDDDGTAAETSAEQGEETVGEGPGDEDVEMGEGTGVIGEPVSQLQQRVEMARNTVLGNPQLAALLQNDPELEELLDNMQAIADDPSNPSAQQDMDQAMGRLYDEYITPATAGMQDD
ncbi:hypothetical protein CBER1_01231 [Cercospora berteroae]|uniref:Uncharacterized protein n=1 Tax=Cercospora berteroae TaxID=357750 RepID=A0A2S6CIV9_9PEZI|nr:hypothetical protein CBER1_01231 [Cercospora berteroae]